MEVSLADAIGGGAQKPKPSAARKIRQCREAEVDQSELLQVRNRAERTGKKAHRRGAAVEGAEVEPLQLAIPCERERTQECGRELGLDLAVSPLVCLGTDRNPVQRECARVREGVHRRL